jgi:hypothetical protein
MIQEPTDDAIKKLVMDGATDQEICDLHDLSWETLSSKFGQTITAARAERRLWLRRLQNEAAAKGSASILSLLGKYELGQTTQKDSADEAWPEPQLDPKVG